MTKKRIRLYNLQKDYFKDLAQSSENNHLDLNYSPLVAARKRLAVYIGMILWRLYRSEAKHFGDCFTFMDGVCKLDDRFDEMVFDGIEEVALRFRQDLVQLEELKPTLKETDLRELLECFSQLLEEVVEKKSKRHRLAPSLQRHFNYTVVMASEGRRNILYKAKAWDDWDTVPTIIEQAKTARDKLYQEDSSRASKNYLESIRRLMEYSNYGKWINQVATEKPWLRPLQLEALPRLTEELEVELLWQSLTKNKS